MEQALENNYLLITQRRLTHDSTTKSNQIRNRNSSCDASAAAVKSSTFCQLPLVGERNTMPESKKLFKTCNLNISIMPSDDDNRVPNETKKKNTKETETARGMSPSVNSIKILNNLVSVRSSFFLPYLLLKCRFRVSHSVSSHTVFGARQRDCYLCAGVGKR